MEHPSNPRIQLAHSMVGAGSTLGYHSLVFSLCSSPAFGSIVFLSDSCFIWIIFNRPKIILWNKVSNVGWISPCFLFPFRYFMTWSDRSIGKHQWKRRSLKRNPACCFRPTVSSSSEPGECRGQSTCLSCPWLCFGLSPTFITSHGTCWAISGFCNL